jgi:regulator of sigma D
MLERTIILPRRSRGRPTATAMAQYERELEAFCHRLIEIDSSLDFKVSSRGWGYLLEEHGLAKGDFDAAERVINDCRKAGHLPVDFCAEDEGRGVDNLEEIDNEPVEAFAESWVDYLSEAHEQYTPFSFWDDLDVYLEMTVEKIDLKNLFSPECARFHLATTNISGWNDINRRVQIMRRFARWERQGKKCILLHCGDHDPGGLRISEFLRSNFEDLAKAVGWHPRKLHIERFGLNYEFIRAQRLTWIDNLETSSGGRLDDSRHPDHDKDYVQSYLKKFGARKVEANALVTRPEAGRALCRSAILKYVPPNAPKEYEKSLRVEREVARGNIARLMRKWGRP